MAYRGGWLRRPPPSGGAGRSVVAAGLIAVLAGCGAPHSMQVRSSGEPRHEDDDVRFRTTYFFRVFDYCSRAGRSADDPASIKIDSLYRFRMTGKANALFNDVVFESGTLKSYEIDPFGAAVAYDKANRRFYFRSRTQTERAAACAERDEEVDRLRRQYQALGGEQAPTVIKSAIEQRLKALLESELCMSSLAPTRPPTSDGPVRAVQMAGYRLGDAAAALEEVQIPQERVTLPLGKGDAGASPVHEALKGAGLALRKLTGDTTATGLAAAGEQMAALGAILAKKATDDVKPGSAQTPLDGNEIKLIQQRLSDSAKSAVAAAEELKRAAKNALAAGSAVARAASPLDALGLAFEGLGAHLKIALSDAKKAGKEDQAKAYAESVDAMAAGLVKVRKHMALAAEELGRADEGGVQVRAACGPGEQLRRGFQVLGPEGFRTFDQDDRLIMAMSSRATPLIGQIKDISNRFLSEQTAPGDALLALVQARLKASEVIRALNSQYGETGEKITDVDAAGHGLADIKAAVAKGMAP